MLLEVRNLHVFYGVIHALWGVNIEVEEGEVVSIIGANGAGKTTLLRAIVGFQRVAQGEVLFCGKRLPGVPHLVAGQGIVLVPEGRQVFVNLSVRENLLMGAYLRRKDRAGLLRDMDRVIEKFPRLGERLNQRAGTLSGGEQQMLAIGRGLMSRPRLLLLDEPSLGLAPMMVNEVFQTLRAINTEGTSLLLVEQNARKALKLSHRSYVLENGRVVKEGTGEQLLGDQEVIKAYLGA